jgi:hypothetical protein
MEFFPVPNVRFCVLVTPTRGEQFVIGPFPTPVKARDTINEWKTSEQWIAEQRLANPQWKYQTIQFGWS